MDKQTLPIIILCVLLLVFWQQILDLIFGPPPKPAGGAFTNRTAAVSQPSAASAPAAPAMTNALLKMAGPAPVADAEKAVLENDLVCVTFTSRGGGIEQVVLKKFEKLPGVRKNITLNEFSPLPALSLAVNETPFLTPCKIKAAPDKVLVESATPQGLLIAREFTLQKGDYLIQAAVSFKNNSPFALTHQTLQMAVGLGAPMNNEDRGDYVGFSFMSGEKAVNETLAAVFKKPFMASQAMSWAAVRNQYFALVITPPSPFTEIHAESLALPAGQGPRAAKDPQGVLTAVSLAPLNLKPGASTNLNFQVYAGPKEYQRLEKLGQHQDLVMDFGWWEVFCKALLWLMGIFNGIFHNWGISIIAVTVLVKIVFWPLTAMSTKSMKQMQALAPKMNALKEKYKDDAKKMNEEMMKLYREYKVNPMAGCLPMLIQIPIFFAFYKILQIAIELRGAPFFWWITDLSRPDTVAQVLGMDLNVMPLLMAVTMIWNTFITPQGPSTDPSMKMMMWLMPAMFLFFCYNFSSGLSLYWTVQNLLTILQTYLTRDQTATLPEKTKPTGRFSFGRLPGKK